ncbi:unnamed protein product [Strongylus vulgaris]|uniref:Uncharacterized protein n=1 Tax=Strongylus vulgaris TaxID=40348 RepID=A0A3P7LH23_STRVU|nr:unnamed protein product [Strongylus vulgaris]
MHLNYVEEDDLLKYKSDLGDDPIPESFDAREKWPECKSVIGRIRDQSNCGTSKFLKFYHT